MAAAALGAAELGAALLPGTRSFVLAVGDVVIDSVPGWFERAAIAVLGTADKPVLVVGILVVSAVLGAVVGVLAARRLAAGAMLLTGFVALGVLAALADPRGGAWGPVLVGVVAAGVGVAVLAMLLRVAPEDGDVPSRSFGRRSFLGLASGTVVLAALAAAGARLLVDRDAVERVRRAVRIPRPARPAPPPPPDADLEIAGLTPLYVPNEDFYRIDTALTVPQVDPSGWSLQVTGMVDRPFSLSYQELLEIPMVEADVTLSCVSNEVGGDLVGNARWQGVPLTALLQRAGVRTGGTQVLGRSVDGFSAGFPTAHALAEPDAMVAVAMNGEPLPAEHGFPARLVVPGLYGYVSATKWLSVLELTDWDDVDGYWVPRGWAKEGPVRTQSRIDVPRPGAGTPAGRQAVAGVAWAPTRGIERVEVRVDDGPWEQADLAAALDVDSWRQWVYRWDATPGEHRLTVRATDGTGQVQTPERAPVAPSGATGHHTVRVLVEG